MIFRRDRSMRFGALFYAMRAVVSLISAAPAQATPIRYTFATIASGSLGGTSFQAPLTITAFADTDDVFEFDPSIFGPAIYGGASSVATVAVDGFPTAVFTIPTISVSNTLIPSVGFSASVEDFAILFSDSPQGGGYELADEFGPISGPPVINPGHEFATNYGAFVLNVATSPVIFQAIFVPEPSCVLAATAFVTIIAIRRTHRPAGN